MTQEKDSGLYYDKLKDGGPVYKETIGSSGFIIEPWNAFSSLLILLPAVYWFSKLRRNYKDYLFVMYCVPLLFLGGLGSTLFHAFRASPFLLLMDVLPTAILTLSVGIYFWVKLLPKWWYILLVLLVNFGLRWAISGQFSPHTEINISYFITGFTIFLPILLLSAKDGFKKLGVIIISIVFLALSLLFREIDASTDIGFLPMGTHFLWHSLSGVGAYFLAFYLVYYRRRELRSRRKKIESINT